MKSGLSQKSVYGDIVESAGSPVCDEVVNLMLNAVTEDIVIDLDSVPAVTDSQISAPFL